MVRKLYGKFDEGELEVIVGAKELDLRYVLIDESAAKSAARKLATLFLLRPIEVVGLLMLAKESGKIPRVKPLLDQLIAHEFFLSTKLYRQVLTRVGEM
jgi:predicted nucleic acid-binding protein